MGYFKELNNRYSDFIDCYWETDGFEATKVYPSLPEPYINIFFAIGANGNTRIKGISAKPDYFEMNSELFGVRLYLKGYLQLNLVPCIEITNNILDFQKLGDTPELNLQELWRKSESFEERRTIFKKYFKNKMNRPLSDKNKNVADAFNAIIENYKDPSFISNYSIISGKTERTLLRWFKSEIGIATKLILRIVRFHNTLSSLHNIQETGFYLDYGYFDQPHFIKEFKYFTGLSPEKYRKMIEGL